MTRLRRNLFLGACSILLLLGLAGLARTLMRQSRGPIREDQKRAERTAKYTGPGAEKHSDAIEANGVIEPSIPEIRLTTDIAGRIFAVYVHEGEEVKKGALLAEVENTMQRAQVARAEADLSAAGAEMQRTLHGMRVQDVNAVVSDAVAARARAALAESDLARAQELSGKGTVAVAELDQAKRRSEAEGAAARAATERARGASAGSRQEDVLVAQARVQSSTAMLEEARGALSRTQIYAPCDARILRLKLHSGEFHNPASEPLMIVGDTSRLRVRIDVDERDIARLKVDDEAYVTATAFGAERFKGRIAEISQRMGRRSVRIDDPKDRVDVKVLEALIELEGRPPFVAGMRVSATVGKP